MTDGSRGTVMVNREGREEEPEMKGKEDGEEGEG